VAFSPGDLKVNFKRVTCYNIEYRKTEPKDVHKAPGNLPILATCPLCVRCSFVGKISTSVSFIITHPFIKKSAHLLFKKKI